LIVSSINDANSILKILIVSSEDALGISSSDGELPGDPLHRYPDGTRASTIEQPESTAYNTQGPEFSIETKAEDQQKDLEVAVNSLGIRKTIRQHSQRNFFLNYERQAPISNKTTPVHYKLNIKTLKIHINL